MTTVINSIPAGPAAATTVDLGPAVALECRECGNRTALGPFYACIECFGPLEVAYDFTSSGEAPGSTSSSR